MAHFLALSREWATFKIHHPTLTFNLHLNQSAFIYKETNFMNQDNESVSPQASRFLSRLLAMDAPSQQAFRRIYALAPRHRLSAEETKYQTSFQDHPLQLSIAVGRHVRVAMVESLSHTAIAEWVRMNLALRIGLKLAETTQQKRRASRLESVLESFHIASDAFIFGISLERAQVLRRKKAKEMQLPRIQELTATWKDGLLMDTRLTEEIKAIAEFKQKIIPGFARSLRRQL
jgi:hypothetical protein